MPYTSAILGCGPRSEFHILAYKDLKEITLQSVCDKDAKRLHDCGERFAIANLYEDMDEMLKKERPDILHIVTPPSVREEPMELAEKYGVKGIIVEKPIALNPAQANKIKDIARRSGIKIVVNMQRRYFKTCQGLKKILNEKKIGDIQFVRCVTKGNILSMGPHMIDLLLYFLNDESPTHVWACGYGMNGYDYGHPAPANILIEYTFTNQVVTYCEDGEDAVGTIGEEEFWQHLEFNFWGTKGRAWWTQNRDWGYQTQGMEGPFIEKSRWDESDPPGQREFTRALAQWLDNGSEIHLNCLDNALRGFETIMAALQSAYMGKKLELPVEVETDIVDKLEKRLKES